MFLVPRCTWKCVLTAISGNVDISQVPWCHLLWQMNSQRWSQKIIQGLVSYELTAYLSVFDLYLTHEMTILAKGRKLDSFEWNTSLKNLAVLTFEAFVRMSIFVELNSLGILALCETNLDDLIDSMAISLWGVIFL